ncbi:MAG: c-type cytochrome [Acetobacteraceae bacterium]
MTRLSRFALVLTIACLAAAPAAAQGDYTAAQAAAGKAEFAQVCAICHGDHLQGKVGPALSGQMFLSVSQYQGLTAWYLYHFMSTHMPQNAPGSLTQTQYLDLMAYILKFNGYPAGADPLTPNETELKTIKIAPQTGTEAASKAPQQ